MDFMAQGAAAVFVLALLGLTLWWLRRRGFTAALPPRRSGPRRLECLDRLALGPQTTLHLVRFGQTALLVASTPAGCTLVESRPLGEIEAAR
jgi:flagellar biosynthetic protein FliO